MSDPVVDTVVSTVIDVLVTFDQPVVVTGQDPAAGFTITVNGDQRTVISAVHDGARIRMFVSTLFPEDVVAVVFDNTTPYVFDDTEVLPAVSFSVNADNQAAPFYAAARIYAPEIEFLDGIALPRVEIELSRVLRQLVRRFGSRPINPSVTHTSGLGTLTVTGTPAAVGGGTAVTARVSDADPILSGAAAQEWQTVMLDRVIRAFAELVLLGEAVGAVINPSQTVSL